ncbi:MAG: phosphoglycerate kinase [Bacillota bacterium]|nr:phosphoglycerate kinase [Bacillota bacterium]
MINKKSIEDVEVAGEKILVRSDFNVPLENGRVRDDTRIKAAVPTIQSLINRGARVVLASHLGRPGGEPKPELKMDPVADRLALILGRPVQKINSVVGPEVNKKVVEMQEGEVLILENLRFEKGEEKNDPQFARLLAEPFDLFVNDAFGTAHRTHASTAGVASFLPAVAGLLMKKEIEELSRCLNDPARPLTAIIGGAKVSGKINVIRRFLDLADNLLLGGGMANTFLVADGFTLGDSFYEEEMVEEAADLLDESEESRCCLLLPVDLAVTEELKTGSSFKNLSPEEVEEGGKAVDIGPETVALFGDIIADAAMIIWNGPMGVFEVPPFDNGTAGVAAAIAGSEAYSVVGGGDLVAALEGLGLTEKINFISTGGGATLEFLEGKELPGIAVLQDK